MLNRIADISPRQAAIIVGIGFLIMLFLSFFVDFFVLSNFIGPGDAATLANEIAIASYLTIGIAIAGYLIILTLDVAVALALYVILKPVNKNQSLLAAVFRLIYTAILVIGLLALVLFLDAYSFSYGKLIGYLFFIPHIFVLGYVVFKSGYIPRILGVSMIISGFGYILLFYGTFLLPTEWHAAGMLIASTLAFIGEIPLGIWLLLKSDKIPEMKS